MKKVSKIIFAVSLSVIVFIFLGIHPAAAQAVSDSTKPIVDSTGISIINQFVDWAQHWPIVASIVSIIALVSEILSIIPDKYIPANGVLHSIYLLIKSITWKKK